MADRTGPSTPDFSPRAVARAVLRETVTRPYVLYPAAVGILGAAAAALLGPSLLFVVPAAVGAAVGLGAWGVNFGLRRDQIANDYLKRLQQALSGRVQQAVAQLREDFVTLNHERALEQLARLEAKFAASEDLLRRKLKPGEMTFNRYLGMTEQVFLAGLDNLRQVADAVHGIATIDARQAQERQRELDALVRLSEAQRRERAALAERVALLQRQGGKVEVWLAENEQALTQMDHVMAAIADMDTAQDQAQMDMGPAMQELKSLIERAHNYIREDSDEAQRAAPNAARDERALVPPPKQGS